MVPIRLFRSVALVAGLTAGCASSQEAEPFGNRRPVAETIEVTIDNRNFSDATVVALWEGGTRDRVGVVTGLTSRTFTLDHRTDAIRFEIDYLAGPDYVGELISVSPGEHLEIRLGP